MLRTPARGDTVFYYLEVLFENMLEIGSLTLTVAKTPSAYNEHRKLEEKLDKGEALEPIKFLRAWRELLADPANKRVPHELVVPFEQLRQKAWNEIWRIKILTVYQESCWDVHVKERSVQNIKRTRREWSHVKS